MFSTKVGKPRHSQSQGSVERANQDIENMLCCWMKDKSTTAWSKGLRFVQFMKNRSLHSGIKRSPYEAMFGVTPKVGLSDAPLPESVLRTLKTEEELEMALEKVVSEDKLCRKSETTKRKRDECVQSLEKQALKMRKKSDANFPNPEIGDTVRVQVPDVDRGKTDARSIGFSFIS